MTNVKDRAERVRNALTIRGCTFPKKAGVLREEHITVVDSALADFKTKAVYSLTVEQYVFIKNRGGSAFLRELISWFAAQEAKMILNATGEDGTGAITFGGYPVLLDVDSRALMWETYFWAKKNGYSADDLRKDLQAKQ